MSATVSLKKIIKGWDQNKKKNNSDERGCEWYLARLGQTIEVKWEYVAKKVLSDFYPK